MRRSAAFVFAVAVVSVGVAAARAERADAAPRWLCRVFPVALEGDAGWDSADPSHPIGAWVAEMGAQGWAIASVELTAAQKPTGYPQGYQQVCLAPR